MRTETASNIARYSAIGVIIFLVLSAILGIAQSEHSLGNNYWIITLYVAGILFVIYALFSGIILCGVRELTNEEEKKFHNIISKVPHQLHAKLSIATSASTSKLFFPVIPFETVIAIMLKDEHGITDTDWPAYYSEQAYQIVGYPVKEGKVYWKHVFTNWQFFIGPILLLIIIGGAYIWGYLAYR